MYRRVNSGRFLVLTTSGIVVVMAIFTWVMYGMAQRVYKMTDVMVDLNGSMKSMVTIQTHMSADIHNMRINITAMNKNLVSMNNNIGIMSHSVDAMTQAMQRMNIDMHKMTYDIGRVTYAMSHPISYMWGGKFPF